MSTLTIELSNKRFAPWGVFRRAYVRNALKSIPVIWLTDDAPKCEIEESDLNESEIQNIIAAAQFGYVIITGLDVPIVKPVEVSMPTSLEVSNTSNIIDVTSLYLKEESLVKTKAPPRGVVYPQVEEFLNRPVNQVKKDLKEMIKKGASISFFTECRIQEEKGKARKTILSILLDVLKGMINSVGRDGSFDKVSGKSLLSDAYYSLIEEAEEEEEDID